MSDLRSRLQRLRPHTAPRVSAPEAARPEPEPTATPSRLPGHEHATARGVFQLIEERRPLAHRHGHFPFETLLHQDAALLARLARAPAFAAADLRGLAFLDTETTGLAGGAGTLAFLVGVGVFDGGDFVLRQYFLRRPDEEPALLAQLLADLAPRAGWVTFNGRAFDIPLLETRLTLNRQRSPFPARPHLDLLFPARWLYRGRLESCALSSLERHVLGVPRSDADVPGALIPQMYVDYLRTGDAREMRRVIYHNAVDIFSMVTLAAHLLDVFATRDDESPTADRRPRSAVSGQRSPEEWLRLALWHDQDGRPGEAEAAFGRALAGKLSLDDRRLALTRFAALLKRLNRRAEAAPLWEQLASFTLDDALPCIELSKYYEWKSGDPALALAWARRAEAIIQTLPAGWRRTEAQTAIARRLARLATKLGP